VITVEAVAPVVITVLGVVTEDVDVDDVVLSAVAGAAVAGALVGTTAVGCVTPLSLHAAKPTTAAAQSSDDQRQGNIKPRVVAMVVLIPRDGC
jgi:hypothetical protein